MACHRHKITSASGPQDRAKLKMEQEKLCLSCHLQDAEVIARMGPKAGFIAAYQGSVHGSALEKGNGAAANCVDCHGSHTVQRGSDPRAALQHSRLQNVCAKCHGAIAKEYEASVHGAALAKGVAKAPVCTDCHGEHTIYKAQDPRSPVASKNVSAQVCTPCHGSVALSMKYGLPKDRSSSFADSYHGLAIRGGSVAAANCASCHGAHNILPSSDPLSTVAKQNLAVTCGKCHPGANARFGIGAVHVVGDAKSEPILYWIATIYIGMILGTIGGMLAHNALDFVKKSKRHLLIRRGELEIESAGRGLYLRMTLAERFQHASLMISFTLLVLTGFMLRYPDAFWVSWVRGVWEGAFEARSVVHRIAGAVMVVASVFHVFYLAFTARGRQLVRDLFPMPQDARDVILNLRYYLGLSEQKPAFARFGYVEKAEYWALVWGTGVMAVTGLIMWFENSSIGVITKLGWDISRTVHFYEAWLATLAILVWHIYFVIFNPDAYPMNMAWITGHLTEIEMEEEHPLELERIRHQRLEEELRAAGMEGAERRRPSAEGRPAALRAKSPGPRARLTRQRAFIMPR